MERFFESPLAKVDFRCDISSSGLSRLLHLVCYRRKPDQIIEAESAALEPSPIAMMICL